MSNFIEIIIKRQGDYIISSFATAYDISLMLFYSSNVVL